MTDSNTRILGLAPSARKIGVSVLVKGELVFYGIKSLKKSDSKTTLKRINAVLDNLFSEFEINCVAIERLSNIQQKRSSAKTVFDSVVDRLKVRRMRSYLIDPKDIRKELSQGSNPTRFEVAVVLSKKFPELKRYLVRQKPWSKYHFSTLFDAVAAGYYCSRKLNQEVMGERKPHGINANNLSRPLRPHSTN